MKRFLFLSIFAFIFSFSFAQQAMMPVEYAQKKFFDSSATVLPLLINAALKNAPEMKKQESMKNVAAIDLKLAKNEILKQFYINGNYNYGSTSGSAITGIQNSQFNAFSRGGSAIYLVGLNLNLSFEQLFGGIGSRIKKQKLIVEQTDVETTITESSVRIKVITLYKGLLLSKILYDHSVDALQTAYVNKNLVDKQFRSGEVKVTDQMASNDLYARAVTDMEQTKSNYQLNLLLLEELIGMPFNQFVKENIK